MKRYDADDGRKDDQHLKPTKPAAHGKPTSLPGIGASKNALPGKRVAGEAVTALLAVGGTVLRRIRNDPIPLVGRGARNERDQRLVADVEHLVRNAGLDVDEVAGLVLDRLSQAVAIRVPDATLDDEKHHLETVVDVRVRNPTRWNGGDIDREAGRADVLGGQALLILDVVPLALLTAAAEDEDAVEVFSHASCCLFGAHAGIVRRGLGQYSGGMDRSFVEENSGELKRLKAIVSRLTDDQLSTMVNEYWSVAGVLGHMAFWDGRALFLAGKLVRGEPFTVSDDEPENVDWINDSTRPLIHAVPPRAMAELAVAIAEETDQLVASMSPEIVSKLDERSPLNPVRAHHRREHLDEIETALRT